MVRFVDDKHNISYEITGWDPKPLSIYTDCQNDVFTYVILDVQERGLGWRQTFGNDQQIGNRENL